ncbi:MAG TPA: hypothetical protein DG753_13480 [Clostridium sp.]|nr:hypothetical protein [Clostridium sp.]
MEKEERRISRVERNGNKCRNIKKINKKINDYIVDRDINYISKDDEIINYCETRVRRSERNKRKKKNRILGERKQDKEIIVTKRDKSIKIVAIILMIIGLIIIGASLNFYFKNNFYYGTSINCLNVSGKSVSDVEEEFKANIVNYNLRLVGRNNSEGEIRGIDIDVNYDDSKKKEIEQIKNEQNKTSWVKAIFSKKKNGTDESLEYTSNIITFDKNKLNDIIHKLKLFNEDIIEPQNASLKYNGKSFSIEKEVEGNKINKDKLYAEVSKAIYSGVSEVDLDKADCYEKPKYKSSSKEVIQAQEKINQYKDFKLVYDLGDSVEEIYGDILFDFFEIDENYSCNLKDDKISAYVDKLCEKYNTSGKTRNLTTTDGRNIIVNGGDYGYEISRDKEINHIKQDIESKKFVKRQPIYSKTALGYVTNDIGSTYVEIDMSKQYLWFYKDGVLITEGSIVTGNVANGTSTPEGIYSLKYKDRDSVLIGQGYRSPVSFWMPFNNNIGIHDASWRSMFGGKIYLSNGSHGCVNAPYKLAQSIYNNIEPGTPIICYN